MNQDKKSTYSTKDSVVAVLVLRWWLIGLFTTSVAISILIWLFATPKFQAEVKALPAEFTQSGGTDVGSLGALAGLAGLNLTPPSTVKYEALEILQSQAFIGSFIENNNLLPQLYPKLWDTEAKSWDPPFWKRQPTIEDGSKRFREDMLRVREDRRTGIITILIEWRDREQAAAWANALVSRLNSIMRVRAKSESEASLSYLNDEVEKTQNTGIKQAIYRLIETEIQKAMLAQVREQYALRIIDPAIVPNERDKVWPRPILLILGGISFGILISLVVLFVYRIRLEIRRSDYFDKATELPGVTRSG